MKQKTLIKLAAIALSSTPVPARAQELPFDPTEILKQPLPWTDSDSGQ
jgi:hypothetical protein